MLTFLFLHQSLCCHHSLESSRRDDSNEWSQNRIQLKLRKLLQKMLIICIAIGSSVINERKEITGSSSCCEFWESKSIYTCVLFDRKCRAALYYLDKYQLYARPTTLSFMHYSTGTSQPAITLLNALGKKCSKALSVFQEKSNYQRSSVTWICFFVV